MQRTETVFVGLSGGVDSAVAALRLQSAGYNVVGVFIKVWRPPFLMCNWEAERRDAMHIAAHLGIPFHTCDAEAAYENEVARYFINEYAAGRTPNPDVMCNKAIKFGAFLDFARAHGVHTIATGHYAQCVEMSGEYALLRSKDVRKDQSYFLWTLTQAQLQHVLLPIGMSSKDEIRAEADAAGLPVSNKKDSQGICFLGHVDIPEFLSHYIALDEGAVLDTAGIEIGRHRGAIVYTIGQRHGFTITEPSASRTPHYVTAKDLGANTITVTTTAPCVPTSHELKLTEMNWIRKPPAEGVALSAQTRYRQTPVPVRVTTVMDDSATFKLEAPHDMPAPGQSCVLYDGEECRGGGIIAE